MIRYIFILLISFNALLAYTTLNPNGITKNFELKYFYDEYSIRTINDITNPKSTHFSKKMKSNFTLGYLNDNSWLKISLHNDKNTTNTDFILSLREAYFAKANFFRYKNNTWEEEKNGFEVLVNQRQINEIYPSFHIHLDANETKTYYLQLATSYPNFAEIKIYTNDAFSHSNKNILMVYLFYFGALFIIFLFIFFLYFILKENIYLYYSLFVFFTSVFVFVLSGTHLLTPLEDYTYLLHTSAPILMTFLILFSHSFLKIDKFSKTTSRLLYTFVVIFIALSIAINIDMQMWYKYITIFASLSFIVLLYASIRALKAGSSQAKYYLVILSAYSGIMAIFTSMVNTWLPYNDFTRYSFLFASFFEVLFFSLVLANRFQLIQKETIQAQEELIIEKTKNTKLLENEVQQRTKEISLLLQEVHHRVKNNFQVIVGLLWMESQKIDESNKEKIVFLELSNKIKAMSMVHQLLYESNDLSSINSKDYLEKIIYESKNIYAKHNFDVKHDIFSMKLSMNNALILGVILNEVLNNSIKHHKDKDNCKIDISLKQNDDKIILKIQDNGSGFTYNKNSTSDGLGLKMIEQFCKKLINAEYKFIDYNGTLFELKFDIIQL